MTKTIIITSVITAVLVTVLLFVLSLVAGNKPITLGAQIQNDLFYFTGGIKAGTAGQFAVSNSGVITDSAAATFSGTVAISQSSGSTLKIGNNSSGLGAGCLVLGDSAGATSSPVYITATGGTLSATTTKPAICK